MAGLGKYWKAIVSGVGFIVTLALVHFFGGGGEGAGTGFQIGEGIVAVMGILTTMGVWGKANVEDEADDVRDMLNTAIKQAKALQAAGKTDVKKNLIEAVTKVMAEATK